MVLVILLAKNQKKIKNLQWYTFDNFLEKCWFSNQQLVISDIIPTFYRDNH